MSGHLSRTREDYWRSYQGAGIQLMDVLSPLSGLVLLVLATLPFFDFPLYGKWILPLALGYLVALLVLPRLWLVILPLATVVLDLSPWTGRYTYNEFDYLFLLTIVSGLLYRRLSFSVFRPRRELYLVAALLLIIALGYRGWIHFLLPPQASFENPYYTSEYAYKVIKGLLWGLALLPMWAYLLVRDKRASVNALLAGLGLGALGLGLVVFWERGTLGLALAGNSWWQVVESLLDLSSSYRVTGLFSDMHTGGETLDGVVLLYLPAVLHAAIYGRSPLLRVLGIFGALALAYTTLVGYTRTTYVAFIATVAVYAALALWFHRRSGRELPFPLMPLLVALVAGSVLATLIHGWAGNRGLLSFAAAVLAGYGLACYRNIPLLRWGLGAAVAALCLYGLSAHLGNRWVTSSWITGLATAASLALVAGASYRLFGAMERIKSLDSLVVMIACLSLPLVVAQALGGYQINARFSQVERDMELREYHWQRVIDSGGGSVWRQLLGNGVGTFPRRYIETNVEQLETIGRFSVVEHLGRRVLRLSGGRDLSIGQRVRIDPERQYSAKVRYRAEGAGEGALYLSLCRRNLIYAGQFFPDCTGSHLTFSDTFGEFVSETLPIDPASLRQTPPLRWPLVLQLRQPVHGISLEVDSITLYSEDSANILKNGNFSGGLDYWFYYNDFSHLPWHVKNSYLLLWFETGWLGLAIFLALVGCLVMALRQHHAFDSLIIVYAAGVAAICLFGLFGSPLDSPRVSWLFYFMLFSGITPFRRLRSTRSGRRPRPASG